MELCKKLNLNPEHTLVVNVDQLFGSKMCMCTAHSYPNGELLAKFEPRYLLKRREKARGGGAAKEEKPAAAAKKE